MKEQTISGYKMLYVNRFWSKVNVLSKDECWEWQAGRSWYGMFWTGENRVGAHRFSLELRLGRRLEEGEWALHCCPDGENPVCVNPNHLYVGDKDDNARDRENYGRTSRGKRHSEIIKASAGIIRQRGEGNHQSKFTEEEILEMRRLFDSGEMNRHQISRKFKADYSTITAIVKRLSWKHLP